MWLFMMEQLNPPWAKVEQVDGSGIVHKWSSFERVSAVSSPNGRIIANSTMSTMAATLNSMKLFMLVMLFIIQNFSATRYIDSIYLIHAISTMNTIDASSASSAIHSVSAVHPTTVYFILSQKYIFCFLFSFSPPYALFLDISHVLIIAHHSTEEITVSFFLFSSAHQVHRTRRRTRLRFFCFPFVSHRVWKALWVSALVQRLCATSAPFVSWALSYKF